MAKRKMGCILEHWVLLGEQKENGNSVRYAKHLLNMKIYRFEPVVTKFAALEAGRFQTGIQERYKALEYFENCNLGLLRVCGSCFWGGKFWLGWQCHSGESFFRSFENQLSLDLAPMVMGLYPLIRAYRLINQAGLIVGRPDWGRLYHDANGIYMVDPCYLRYLSRDLVKLPPGLENCRPPESYSGSELNENGDLFYLGLIIYLALTNRLPFEVINGWPTKALFKGDIISPLVFQPKLHPFLAEQIRSLLHPSPEKRGTARQLESFWGYMLEQKSFLAPAKVLTFNIKEQKKYQRKIRWRRVRLPVWGLGSLLIFLIILVFLVGSRKPIVNDQGAAPFIAVHNLYLTAAGPPRAEVSLEAHSAIMNDFEQDRMKRLNTAAELLGRPIAEIKQTWLVNRTPRQAVIGVLVCRWEWINGKWQSYLYKERLTVEYKGKKWSVTARKPIGKNY